MAARRPSDWLQAHRETVAAVVAGLVVVGQGGNLYQSHTANDTLATIAANQKVIDYRLDDHEQRLREIRADVVAMERPKSQPAN